MDSPEPDRRDFAQCWGHWTAQLCGPTLAVALGAFVLSIIAALAMDILGIVREFQAVAATAALAGAIALAISAIAGTVLGFLEWRREEEWLSPTYPQPKDGWVCFHCGERFLKYGAARDHFGPTPESRPACLIDPGELMDLRKVEQRNDDLEQAVRQAQDILEGVGP